jgi:8-amino-7-oxononanoate synthase
LADEFLRRAAQGRLAELQAKSLRRALVPMDRTHTPSLHLRGGQTVVDFSSNDALGLAADGIPDKFLAHAAIEYGGGATASRLISGERTIHQRAEAAVADWMGFERALMLPSGYHANIAAIGAVAEVCPLVISDALNHASLIDGCRLARAEVSVIAHRQIDALRSRLARVPPHITPAVIIEGLFSMDGDTWDWNALRELKSQRPFVLVCDEAHGVGAHGPEGRGMAACEHASDVIDIVIGTFGKAFGLFGAFIASCEPMIELVINRGRTFVFTTGVSPALAGAVHALLPQVRRADDRRGRLAEHTAELRGMLTSIGVSVLGHPASPIVPVLLGENETALRVSRELLARGFFVQAIRPPTVPDGTARLRIALSAAHTTAQVRALGMALAELLDGLRAVI